MTVVTMPDGVDVSFPDDMPAEKIRSLIATKFPREAAQAEAKAQAKEKAPAEEKFRVKQYPEIYDEHRNAAIEQMKEGVAQAFSDPNRSDPLYRAAGYGKTALGALGYTFSPATSAIHSVVGQPLEYATGLKSLGEYADFAASLAVPGMGFSRARPPGLPLRPGDPIPTNPGMRLPPPEPPPTGVTAAAERLRQGGYETQVPQVIASDSPGVQRTGEAISKVPFIGAPVARSVEQLGPSLGRDVEKVAGEFGSPVEGTNVANRIAGRLEDAASLERQGNVGAAEASNAEAEAAWHAENERRMAEIARRETEATTTANRRVGDVDPQDMAGMVNETTRSAERSAWAAKEAAYQRASQAPGSVTLEGLGNLPRYVSDVLEEGGMTPDPEVAKKASAMVRVINDLSRGHIDPPLGARPTPAAANEVVPAGMQPPVAPSGVRVGVELPGIEQVRKRLGFIRSGAADDADRTASNAIMRAFDKWQNDAMHNHLARGSPDSLETYLDARAANHLWRDRFGFNAERSATPDADKFINRIVTENIQPNEIVDRLIGSKPGAKGITPRLFDRLMEATNDHPEMLTNLRGATWQRLRQAGPDAVDEFLTGSGRAMAGRLFNPEERAIMRAQAEEARSAAAARKAAPGEAAANRPIPVKPDVGGVEKFANTVLGRGDKSNERLWANLIAYTRGGGQGDAEALARIWRNLEKDPATRGDFRSAFIRHIGHSTTTNEFSPVQFATEWNRTSDAAKNIMFGQDNAHRQALEDIAAISQKFGNVHRRYGNPSGTAGISARVGVGTGTILGTITAPLVAVQAAVPALGAYGVSKMLASPAGASSLSKWTKAYNAAASSTSPRAKAMLAIATRNLAKTAGTPTPATVLPMSQQQTP